MHGTLFGRCSINRRRRGPGPGIRSGLVAVAIALAWSAPTRAVGDGDGTASVKAGFLNNFARFAEWPALLPSAPIVLCVVADAAVAEALADAVQGRMIADHAVEVRQPVNSRSWTGCHLLFIGKSEIDPLVLGRAETMALPLLTVSDRKGFSREGGDIELYIDDGHMRFAVNLQTIKRSDIRLSSRLLTLAKLVQ